MVNKVVWKKITVKEATWKQLMRTKLEKGYKSIDELIRTISRGVSA
jgi:hypothetical protein